MPNFLGKVVIGGSIDLDFSDDALDGYYTPAIFYGNYEDLQLSQSNGQAGLLVANAAEATSQGIEIDGRWLITEGLTMTFAGAYLDFQFDDL